MRTNRNFAGEAYGKKKATARRKNRLPVLVYHLFHPRVTAARSAWYHGLGRSGRCLCGAGAGNLRRRDVRGRHNPCAHPAAGEVGGADAVLARLPHPPLAGAGRLVA